MSKLVITLIDSAGIQKFRDQLAEYYKPPIQPMPVIDPTGNTPDAILTENIANVIRDTNRANNTEWQNYNSAIMGCVQVTNGAVSIPYMPHAPLYHSVNVTRFKAGWEAWNDEYNRIGVLPEFTLFMRSYPYLETIGSYEAPEIKIGPEANAPPPPAFTTDLVGAQYMQGVWLATPFAVASAMMQFDPNQVVISDSKSSTGYFRFYHSAFSGQNGFWIPCAKPV